MVRKQMGLKPREEELSEIEKQLGISLVDKSDDVYSHHIDKYVNVTHGGISTQGVYRGTDKNGISIILPVLIGEYQIDPATRKFSDICLYYLETERPASIPICTIVGMKPIRKEHLDESLKKLPLIRD